MDFLHYLKIIFLGLVEGITEFLPVPAKAHLLIAEHLIHLHEPGIFHAFIQTGAVLGLFLIYQPKILGLIGSLDKPFARHYVLMLIVAWAITCLASLLLVQHEHLGLPTTLANVAWGMLIGGLLILGLEMLARNLYPHDDVSWPEAIFVGLAQMIPGVFPGTSRSGSTIIVGLVMGMKRPAATEFSLLLGLPTLFVVNVLDLWRNRDDFMTGGNQLLLDAFLGFFVSTLVAFWVVKWFLYFVQSHSLSSFAIYRVLLGGGFLVALALDPALAQIGKSTAPMDTPPAQAPPAQDTTQQPAPAPAPPSVPSTDATSISTPISPADNLTFSTNTDTSPANFPTNQAVYPRALPVPLDALTNAVPTSNVTILPPLPPAQKLKP